MEYNQAPDTAAHFMLHDGQLRDRGTKLVAQIEYCLLGDSLERATNVSSLTKYKGHQTTFLYQLLSSEVTVALMTQWREGLAHPNPDFAGCWDACI